MTRALPDSVGDVVPAGLPTLPPRIPDVVLEVRSLTRIGNSSDCVPAFVLGLLPPMCTLQGTRFCLQPTDLAADAAELFAASNGAPLLGHASYDSTTSIWRYMPWGPYADVAAFTGTPAKYIDAYTKAIVTRCGLVPCSPGRGPIGGCVSGRVLGAIIDCLGRCLQSRWRVWRRHPTWPCTR